MSSTEKNIEQQYEEAESRVSDEWSDLYSEYDDYEEEPIFEKTNRRKGVQKFRW